jgi:hypothetical protein
MRCGYVRQNCNDEDANRRPRRAGTDRCRYFPMNQLKGLLAVIGAAAQRLWSVSRGFAAGVRVGRPSVFVFRALIDSTARHILSDRYESDGHAILDRIWAGAAERWLALPPQTTLGATITVRLAAVTATAYDVILAETKSAEIATQAVYDIAWARIRKWVVPHGRRAAFSARMAPDGCGSRRQRSVHSRSVLRPTDGRTFRLPGALSALIACGAR